MHYREVFQDLEATLSHAPSSTADLVALQDKVAQALLELNEAVSIEGQPELVDAAMKVAARATGCAGKLLCMDVEGEDQQKVDAIYDALTELVSRLVDSATQMFADIEPSGVLRPMPLLKSA